MNRTVTALMLTATFLSASVFTAAQTLSPSSNRLENPFLTGSISAGYYDGVGVYGSATVANFAQGFPFKVRLGLECNWISAGDAWMARRVFINNNDNGTARGKGKMWDTRLDLLYPINLFSLRNSRIFVGARRSFFNAYFEYIGGAETFDVNANQWGLGGGVETSFSLSPRVDMVLTGGADYYFRSTIAGHDTYYRPNGDDTHPIDNYTYKDADAAINQPNINARLMLGIAYRF